MKNKKQFKSLGIITLFILGFLGFTQNALALTPIARMDVVPKQIIKHGTTFNFGVVAFHKEGIQKVEFTITGQGYSGGVKTSTTMSQNTRVASEKFSGVWEYWVPISSSEFTTNGEITISALVTGNDGGTRSLPAMTMIVEGASAVTYPEVWVSPTGDDATGAVNDRNHPYLTINGAMDGLLAANGNDLSDCTIYLFDGTYTMAGPGKSRPASHWLTITKDAGANRNNVIITKYGTTENTGCRSVPYIKLLDITIQSSAPGYTNWVFVQTAPLKF